MNKEKSNQSNSNFRQQQGTARKLEKDLNTVEQQRLKQTTSVLDGSVNGHNSNDNKSKLKKQYSDQASDEFRQQESTVSKIERTLTTSEQQQFNQTASILDSSSNNQGNFETYSSNVSVLDKPVNDPTSDNNKSKLKKQYSEQANEEFRQQESTVSKIERTLNTSEQQQFNQTASFLDGSVNEQHSSNNNNKLKKQYSNQVGGIRKQESTASKIEQTLNTSEQQQFNRIAKALDSSVNEQNPSNNKSKMKKQYSNQAGEKFQKQESTASKIEQTLNTSGQQQFNQTTNVLDDSTNEQSLYGKKSKLKMQYGDQANDKTQKPKSSISKKKFKLQRARQFGKETLAVTGHALRAGANKYQKELEKDDEGVKFVSQGTTITGKLSAKAVRKLRRKQITNKDFKKARENPLSKEKPKENSLRKISKTPALILSKSTSKYQKELEQGDEGVKFASQGATAIARASKKLAKGTSKISAKSGKLGKQSTKLLQSRFKNKNLRIESKVVLKKKAFKKKLYAPQRDKSKAFTGVLSSFSNRISNIFKNIGKFKFSDLKKLIGAKLAAYFGGGLISVLPLILVAIICLIIAGVFGAGSSSQVNRIEMGGSKGISPDVRQWCSLIEQEAKAQGMEAYVNLVAAIIQVESGGKGTRDIMQSSESAGYPVNYWSTEELSIRQGITHLKNIVNILRGFGAGYESNSKLLAQAYNFGSAFAGYVGRQGGVYTLEMAEAYSREVVAPSLGNHTGATVPYVNETSIRLGKTYRYINGGNFLYGELVSEYGGCSVGAAGVTGDFAIVLQEIEKYQGWPYVWGGKNPSMGFDCSGLTSWGLAQIGIKIPSYAASQYDLTVPINPSEAQPGDLIFFKGTYGGPNHISHVGFYIDENTMYDSNGSGVGYHNWKDPYWQKHFAGIRRVVTK